MTRRIVWGLVLCLVFSVLGGYWFLSRFHQVPVKERTEAGPEARHNAYLALEMFAVRMGRPLARESNARYLDALPAGGVLILDRNRRHFMEPARVDRLMAWVEAGGYLLLVPEFSGVPDPILERLGASWPKPRERPRPLQVPQADENPDCQCRRHFPETLSVQIPGAPRPLAVSFQTGPQADSREPDWSAGDEDFGDQILHYDLGRGHVTVISGLDRLLNNWQIGDHDHAELLWTLLATYQPRGSVTLMSRLAVPNLWDWLVETGWAAGIAGLTLLVLWLWRMLPRFGPAAPEPEPGRRELREHLGALGRYVWRSGGLPHWLQVAREDFHSRLALRHPAVALLPVTERAETLARMTHRPVSLVAAALAGPAETPHAFTAALRTLRKLERAL